MGGRCFKGIVDEYIRLDGFDARLAQLRDPARLKPRVFRIAKNACLIKRRKRSFAPQRELSLINCLSKRTSGDERQIDIADWSNLPEDARARLAVRAQLDR